jgi:macrodomain Ter protein organizer (MatP/YcbG family)
MNKKIDVEETVWQDLTSIKYKEKSKTLSDVIKDLIIFKKSKEKK